MHSLSNDRIQPGFTLPVGSRVAGFPNLDRRETRMICERGVQRGLFVVVEISSFLLPLRAAVLKRCIQQRSQLQRTGEATDYGIYLVPRNMEERGASPDSVILVARISI